jgi:hypothetical protein
MITRKRRDENSDQEITFDQPIAEVFEDRDEPAEQKSQSDDRYDQLAKQLADLQNRLVESERANMALLSNPNWQSQSNEQVVDLDPNKVELPDPALDPNGYDKALAERNRIRADNDRRREAADNRKKQDINEKVEDLWDAFAEKYPDMADDKERIDFVSTQIARQAAKRGVNVERYMFLTRDKFLDDVAAKYIDVFGDPSGEGEDDKFEDAPRSNRALSRSNSGRRSNNRNRQEDEYVGRTGGIFGGNESGGRPSRGRDADEESGPSMIDDIYAIQRKSGFF